MTLARNRLVKSAVLTIAATVMATWPLAAMASVERRGVYDVETDDDAVSVIGRLSGMRPSPAQQPGISDSLPGRISTPSEPGTTTTPTHCSSYIPGLGGWVVDLSGCGTGLPANWIPDAPPPPGEPAPPGEEPALEPEPIVITAEDLQRLPIQRGELTTQPANGWVLVNVETIAMTGTEEHDLITTILGSQVRVRVTPVDFTWDFGDGSQPLVTTDPGAPYPNHTVAHVYTQAHPSRTITLTTRWSGQFQVAGGPWQSVAGTATTTETSAPFEVRTARTSLVTG